MLEHSETSGSLHVIFGAGQVGSNLAALLLQNGVRVRIVKRSKSPVPTGAEIVLADAANASECARAAVGADVIYHCMNPPYTLAAWEEFVPLFMQNLITTSIANGARLVVLDNLYIYNGGNGKWMDEETEPDPVSKKGEVRLRAYQLFAKEVKAGNLVGFVGRASDFYGPGGTLTHFGDQFWKSALAGKTVRMAIETGMVHTYHYIPDVAVGLATLGLETTVDDEHSWMLPCQPAETADELIERFAHALSREIAHKPVPEFLMRGLGLIIPIVRELNEMRYQWETPFVVDDRKFRSRFGVSPEDHYVAASRTVEWARSYYQ